jgi:hypothetical protein
MIFILLVNIFSTILFFTLTNSIGATLLLQIFLMVSISILFSTMIGHFITMNYPTETKKVVEKISKLIPYAEAGFMTLITEKDVRHIAIEDIRTIYFNNPPEEQKIEYVICKNSNKLLNLLFIMRPRISYYDLYI